MPRTANFILYEADDEARADSYAPSSARVSRKLDASRGVIAKADHRGDLVDRPDDLFCCAAMRAFLVSDMRLQTNLFEAAQQRPWEKAMERLYLDRVLRHWIGLQVSAALSSDDELDRAEIEFDVLAQFVRSGNAERYFRRDGNIGWRASQRFLEWLEEGECGYER
jgi:hypothetical protein